jgi:hypothetical protein
MRYAWLGVAAFCGTAAADPTIDIGGAPPAPEQAPHGLSVEAGFELGRLAFLQDPLKTDTHATTEGVHVEPRINLSRYFYAALGFDVAWFNTNGVNQESDPTFSGTDENGTIVPISGTMTTITAGIGARAFAGAFSGNVELGGGERYTALHDMGVSSYGTTYLDTVGVARASLEFWMTPHFTVAAAAEMGLQQHGHDMSFGLMLGAHALAYDAAR